MATSLEVFVVVAGVLGGFASCCCFVLFLCLFAVVAFLGCLICLISLGCFVVVCLYIYIYTPYFLDQNFSHENFMAISKEGERNFWLN